MCNSDYMFLHAFLAGEDHFIDKQGWTSVINENINIIRKMTGLCADTVKKWMEEHKKKAL